MAAGVAVDTEESVGQHTALEIRTDLALDEPSDGRTSAGTAEPLRLSRHGVGDDAYPVVHIVTSTFVPLSAEDRPVEGVEGRETGNGVARQACGLVLR